MSTVPFDPPSPETAEIYRALATADGAARVQHILALIAAHPDGRLVLPTANDLHATLDGVDLDPDRLRTRFDHNGSHPAWWSAERQAVNLRRADLRGASLRHAAMHRALCEEADLSDADLAGANLHAANLSGANLEGTLLEGTDLAKAVLRFARGRNSVLEDAKLQGADLWGADMEGANFSGADLQGATLEEASLQGADFTGADLRGAILRRANLKGANLRGADLRGAVLGRTNFESAILCDARLHELELLDSNLVHVHTSGARLEKTRLGQDQLGGAIGEELAGEYGLARKGYLALEQNFNELGDHDAARWAYLRRRRMEKREARQRARSAWATGDRQSAVRFALKYVGDQAVECVCNYGEGVWRVLGTLLLILVLFVPLYAATSTVLRVDQTPNGVVKAPTHNPVDLALFSLAAMTSPGNPPEYLQPGDALAYFLGAIQTLLSIFLTGLMGFVAGNRIRR